METLNEEKRILGWGKYEFTILWWFFVLWGAVFLDRLVMAFLAPQIMAPIAEGGLAVTPEQFGWIMTFTTGCYAIAAIALTPVLEATGKRKKWLILLSLGAGVFAIIGAFTTDVTQLLITRAVVGFCEGPIAPLIFAMLIKESTPSRIAINCGIVNMGVSIVAILIGANITVQISIASGSWRNGFILAGVISIIVCLVLIKVVREVPFVPEGNKESMWKTLGKLLRNRNIVICFILGILTMVIYWTQMNYATQFFTAAGQDMGSAGAIVSFTGLLGIMWVLVVPKISDFIGRKPAVMMWFALCALAPFVMFGAPTSFAAMILYILLAAIPGSIFPFFQAIIPGESLPNHMLGAASGLIIGFAEIIGGSASQAFLGYLAASTDVPTVILVAGIAAVVAVVIAIFLKETKGKAIETL